MPLITDLSWVSHPLQSNLIFIEIFVLGSVACGLVPIIFILIDQFILKRK